MTFIVLAAIAAMWAAIWAMCRAARDDLDVAEWINEPNRRASEWLARTTNSN